MDPGPIMGRTPVRHVVARIFNVCCDDLLDGGSEPLEYCVQRERANRGPRYMVE